MKSLKIAVCEDTKTMAAWILTLLKQVAAEKKIQVECDVYSSGESLLEADIKKYDVFLLDINLPGITGIQAAREIRKSSEAVIVFISSFIEYAPEGYTLNAYRYILKNTEEEKVIDNIRDIYDHIADTGKIEIIDRESGALKVIYFKDIIFIEAQRNLVEITTVYGVFNGRSELNGLEKSLDERFVRCHRSYIANLDFVNVVYNFELHMNSGCRLPISRQLYRTIYRQYLQRETHNFHKVK